MASKAGCRRTSASAGTKPANSRGVSFSDDSVRSRVGVARYDRTAPRAESALSAVRMASRSTVTSSWFTMTRPLRLFSASAGSLARNDTWPRSMTKSTG